MHFIGRPITAAALVALLVVLLLAQEGRPVVAAFTDSDADTFVDVAETVFGSDPLDATSTPETDSDVLSFLPPAFCADGVDNDGDGAVDLADGGCLDSDRDGDFPDEMELILGSDPADVESLPEDSRLDASLAATLYPFATCLDGQDNDRDGLIDGADPGCEPIDSDADGFSDFVEKSVGADWEDASSRPEHSILNIGSCGDSMDNDGDTLIDAADAGCAVASNDDRADSIVVESLPFSHTAKVAAASVEPGEPTASCIYVENDTQRNTVWYRFTAPADVHLVVNTRGSDLIAAVGVWREATSGLTEVDCYLNYFFLSTSVYSFAASAGETYFIQLDRYPADSEDLLGLVDLGRLAVRIEAATPPPNDHFADVEEIADLPFAASVDTVAATVEPGEPEASCRAQGYPTNSVWYRYRPASDTYVLASALEGTDFGVMVGAYEGTSLAALQQVACGTKLAFHAEAGRTYYLQAAGYRCSSPAGGDGGAASFCLDSRAGQLELHVESFELPSCPPPQVTLRDPVADTRLYGDALPPPGVPDPIDITSLSFASTESVACIGVDLVAPPPPSVFFRGWLDIDADVSRDTGSPVVSHQTDACSYPRGLGIDHVVRSDWVHQGILAHISTLGAQQPPTSQSAYFLVASSSATFIVPLSSIGEDASMAFALEMSDFDSYDCAPNGGNITCMDGACAFAPFRNGDANCSGPADAIDAALILQYGAGLLTSLACPDAADIDGDGAIGSIDAALLLQLSAGLIDQLPPACPKPPFGCQ